MRVRRRLRASAEQWTVYELADLPHHGTRLLDHVVVDGRGDADHVLVGPAGLSVLETGWSADPFEPDADERGARRTGSRRVDRPPLLVPLAEEDDDSA